MRAVWTIAMNDLRLMLSSRSTFAIRLLIPIAFIFVVGVANDAFQRGMPPPSALEIVDLDGSALSAIFASYVENHGGELEISRASDDPAPRLESGASDFAVSIPSGFGAQLVAGNTVTVKLALATSDPQQAARLQSLLDAAGERVATVVRAGVVASDTIREEAAAGSGAERPDVAAAARARVAQLVETERIVVENELAALPDRHELIGFQQSVPGMGSMFVMLTVLAGAALLIEERRQYTMQRTIIAPISRAAYFGGKVAGRFLVGMMQYVVAIATGVVIGMLFGIDFGSSPLVVFAVMAAFSLCAGAIAIFIGTIVRRPQQASGLQTFLAVTLAPIGGAWWSLDSEIVPDSMRAIARFSPFYWVMEGFRAAIHYLGWGEALLPIAVLLGTAAVLIAVGAARFRMD